MTVSYVLAPSPTLQLTDNAGNWVPRGRVRTLDWNTRQPKPTYYDPAGLKARGNPFELDSVGRAFTVYWEDDSAYFLELQDKNGHPIWRSSAPFIPTGGGGGNVTTNIELTNLFVNGQMRFFPIGKYAPIPIGTTLVADGGWNFVKTGVNLADSLEFVRFTPDTTDVDASPTYYLNYVSLGAGTGETQKDLVFRFQDVRTLSDEEVSVSLSLRSALLGTYPVEVFATQYFGTGGAPSADVVTSLGTFTPTLVAQQFTATVTLPNLIGKTIGDNGDDGLFITFRMPLNLDANLEMTDFYFKRGAASLNYPYQSYEEVDATLKALGLPDANSSTSVVNPVVPSYPAEQAYDTITLVPADGLLVQQWQPPVPTGTMLPWVSDIVPNGFVAAAGQTLVRAGQYERLFNVPFSNGTFGTAYGPTLSPTVGVSPWGAQADQVFIGNTDAGAPLGSWGPGNSPFTFVQNSVGWSALEVTVTGLTAVSFRTTNVMNGNSGGVVASTSAVSVTVVSAGTPTTPAEWDAVVPAASAIVASTYVRWATPTLQLYIYFIKDGIGVDPMIPGATGKAVNITSGMDAAETATVVFRAVGQMESGTFSVTPGNTIAPGSYFLTSKTGRSFQFYYRVDGSINVPTVVGSSFLVPISILSTDSAAQVALKTAAVFNPLEFNMPDWRGYFMRFTDNGHGIDPDAGARTNRGDGTVGDNVGTFEAEDVQLAAMPQVWANQAGGIGLTPTGGPYDFDVYTIPTGNETRPINVYFTAIVKY